MSTYATTLSLKMSDTANKTALETLDALEDRIRRVGWYLSGSDNAEEALQQVAANGRDQTAQARLEKLENDLAKLSARSTVVRDLLQLREFAVLGQGALLIIMHRRQIS